MAWSTFAIAASLRRARPRDRGRHHRRVVSRQRLASRLLVRRDPKQLHDDVKELGDGASVALAALVIGP